jgi:hypothetical protein
MITNGNPQFLQLPITEQLKVKQIFFGREFGRDLIGFNRVE